MNAKSGIKRFNLAAMVVTACLGVFLALAFSNFFLLQRSGKIANDVRYEQERKLVLHELKNQLVLFAHAQSQISDWDASYDAFKGEIDEAFVLDNITDWLWIDFGILMTYVVTPENKTKIAVYKDTRLQPGAGESIVKENLDLVEQARAKYLLEYSSNKPMPAAELTKNVLANTRDGRFSWSVRTVNGRLAAVIAQVIGPDRAVEMKDFRPDILFTVRPIDKDYLIAASKKLMVKDLHFETLPERHDESGYFPAVELPDGQFVHARWTPEKPSDVIWQQTLPVLAWPFAITAIALIVIAWRFSNMLQALQKSEAQNRFLALHDALTGLPNRLSFDRSLEAAIAGKKLAQFAIISLDLDRFKAVNDNFGHEAGDLVLTSVSHRIAQRIRENGIVARVGGDEFSILLYDHLDGERLQRLCEKLIDDVSIPVLVPGGVADVGASIGVALWPEDGDTVKAVLRRADAALYMSKDKGRGRVSFAAMSGKDALIEGREEVDENLEKLREMLAQAS